MSLGSSNTSITPSDGATLSSCVSNRTPLATFWLNIPRPLRAKAVWLMRGLSRPSTADWYFISLLVCFVALWTITNIITNLAVSLPIDTVETFALSRDLSLGYIKHPPLINWITAAWFRLMPIKTWSFFLLAMLNVALSLWLVWRAASYVADPRRRIMAVALLGFTTIYTFRAANFNHNAISLTLWPMVVLAFFASIERTQFLWSVLFGAACGVAILGKYYAGLIILACFICSFLHPNARSYWRSTRPVISIITCALVIFPNIYWLINNHYVSITYHIHQEYRDAFAPLIKPALLSPFAYIAYLLPIVVVIWFLLRPWTLEAIRSVAFEWRAKRAVIGCIAFVPGLLPLLLMPLAGIVPHGPWAFPSYFFVPLAILTGPFLFVTYRAATMTVGLFAIVTLGMLAVSPILMLGNFVFAKSAKVAPYSELAQIMTDRWRNRTGRRLDFISGEAGPVWSVSFYSLDHPKVFPGYSERPPQSEIETQWKERGILALCSADNSACIQRFSAALPTAERGDVTLPVTFFGIHRKSETYVSFIAPGRAD
jgi:hypothetical protein